MWFRAIIFALVLALQAFAGGPGVTATLHANGPGLHVANCHDSQKDSRDSRSNPHRQHHNCLFCHGCCLEGFSPVAACIADAELITFRAAASRLVYGFAYLAPPSSRAAQAHRARAPPALI
jgi:hypothetical protein